MPKGIDTVTSRYGRDYEIEGTPPNPKNVISPWIQSTR